MGSWITARRQTLANSQRNGYWNNSPSRHPQTYAREAKIEWTLYCGEQAPRFVRNRDS